MICYRFFLKDFSIMAHNMWYVDHLKLQLGNLGQNYATLCLKQLGLKICSPKILKFSSMMGFNIQSNVMFVSLPKSSPSTQRQLIRFGPKLSNLMFHDSLSENCFKFYGILGRSTKDNSKVSQFFFWGNMGPILPKITLLNALEIFRSILAWWDATVRH